MMWNLQLRNVKAYVEKAIKDRQCDLYGCCYPYEKCNPADPWASYTETTKRELTMLQEILKVIEKEEASLLINKENVKG